MGRYNRNPRMRIQYVENVNMALEFIKQRGVTLTNIGAEGNRKVPQVFSQGDLILTFVESNSGVKILWTRISNLFSVCCGLSFCGLQLQTSGKERRCHRLGEDLWFCVKLTQFLQIFYWLAKKERMPRMGYCCGVKEKLPLTVKLMSVTLTTVGLMALLCK